MMIARSNAHRSLWVLLLVYAAWAYGGWARADEPSSQTQVVLQPIVVTATRHSTTVQTTPISIQAFTGTQIASSGIVDVDSLVRSVPDIAVRDTGGPGEMEFEIRGLNSQGGNSSMVGMYLDEIPLSTAMASQLGKNSMNPGLYDQQRVEVLSGPQGTLYGSSSMGGTIRLIPNAPRLNTYAASAEQVLSDTASGGGINHQENAMLNLPLGNEAAVRVVGSFSSDSGWIKRLVIADGAVPVDGGLYPAVQRPRNFYSAPLQIALDGVNTTRIDSIRAELLWQPIENLTIRPLAMYQSILQSAPPAVDVNGNPTHPQVPSVLAHYEIYDSPEPQEDILSFGSLTTVYQLPAFSLTSATGFWHRNFLDLQDCTEQLDSAIGIPAYDPAAGGVGPCESNRGPGTLEQDYSRQISEELRVTSTAPGPLQWVAGYFYQDLYSEGVVSALSPQGGPILGGPNDYVGSVPEILVQNAIYGHLSWRLSRHFEVAAGFRHYHYGLNQTSSQVGAFTALAAEGNNVPFNAGAAVVASGTVPSFTLTYNIDRDHMVYARVGKGFRLGGASGDGGPVPVVAASNTNPLLQAEVANECALQAKILLATTCNPDILLQAPATYGSDSLWSYELGEKSSFFHNRLIANIDAYLENWYHPQVATNLAAFGMTVNGGDARIKGVDGQFEALLPAGFDVSLNASYTRAEFVESSALTGFPAGTTIPDTPRVAGSASLHWEHELANGLTLSGTLDEDYTGARTDLPFGVAATLQNVDQVLVHLPAYSIANVRFGLRGERNGGDRWTATLFVNNFTNNVVLIDPQPQIALQTQSYARYIISQPLTAGVDVSYQFH